VICFNLYYFSGHPGEKCVPDGLVAGSKILTSFTSPGKLNSDEDTLSEAVQTPLSLPKYF